MSGKRLGIVLSLLGSCLLIAALFLPWWTAVARMPEGTASAQLTVYSFDFRTASYSCTTILVFYAYGVCPLLGSGLAMLSFYLFWTLVFLVLSSCLGIASTISLVRGEYHQQRLSWVPAASAALNVFSNLSFVAAVATAGIKFVGGNPIYGSSDVLTWNISFGFLLALSSTAVQLIHVYFARWTM